jgi:predicted membrane-bound spermidine synthase
MLCKIPSFINGMNAELFTHLQDSYHSIMDALDPNDGIEFAAGLYNSSSFEQSLMNALADDGILVAQLG